VAEFLELLSILVGAGNFDDKQLRRNMGLPVRYSHGGIASEKETRAVRRGDLVAHGRYGVFGRHRQNIISSDTSSAEGLNGLEYKSRLICGGILQEVDIHFAVEEALSNNIKRMAQGVDY